jgi:hypothetical protein
MSRRAWIALVTLIVLLLGLEVALRLSQPAMTGVEIINGGDSMIANLVITFEGSRVGVGDLAAGQSAHVWLSGKKKGTLSLSFTQDGNPMSGFQVADFDPQMMRQDGLKQVLQIKPNEVTKYMDDEQSSSPLGRLRDRIYDWFAAELNPFR